MVGDELGARVVAARLVSDLMRLSFLLERRYAPYSKWLGSAFSLLACAPALRPVSSDRALDSRDATARDYALLEASETAAVIRDAIGLTSRVRARRRRFFSRPFEVIDADAIASALRDAITDTEVRDLGRLVGSVDQFVDSTYVLGALVRRLREE